MSYLMIDVKCTQCEAASELLIHRDETGPWPCEACGEGQCVRQLSAPAIRTSDSRSFRDGYKRPGWEDLKREAALDVAIAQAETPSQRKDLLKEKYGKRTVV